MKKMNEVVVEESATPHLCDELITDILLRVPGKTLSRCKLVCKHWRNLIIDTYFSQAVKSLPPITAGFFYFERPNDYRVERPGDYRVKYYCCITKQIYHNVIPPDDDDLIIPFKIFKIVASHNGFVLCVESTDASPRFFVCNPYTKQWVVLSSNPNLREVRTNNVVLFCYEKQGSDAVEFKVLSFNFLRVWSCQPPDMLQVHIFSSETGEWTISEMLSISPAQAGYFRKSEKILLAPDFVYLWHPKFPEVGVYDLNRESIRFLTLPRSDAEESFLSNLLGVSAGSVYYAEMYCYSISMWVHDQKDKWFLECVVSCEEVSALNFHTFRLVGFHPMKLGLIMQRGGGKVFLYHAERRKVELLPYFHPDETPVVPYMLPEWLPRLKNSRSMNQGVWRSPLSLHEIDTINEKDSTISFVPESAAYYVIFLLQNDVIPGENARVKPNTYKT